ncbi:MAG TPA: C13 family peptidase [Stellaceae bacterium]|nr:C13 family peptidase [Stellaceae bacterium]
MPYLVRLLLAAMLLVVGSALARTPAPPVRGWQAVLVAGDNAEPVFANAVAAIDRWLVADGVPQRAIFRLSAKPAGPGIAPATLPRVLAAVAALHPRPGEGCLVFITSHGNQRDGLFLADGQRFLDPASLARALAVGCRVAPTAVIASGCYSGAFARGAMRAPNRVILTASRADRPSFGCRVGRTYTVFDQCLIAALPQAADWRIVFRRERRCVRRNERRLRVRPSRPQAYFGAAVKGLALP